MFVKEKGKCKDVVYALNCVNSILVVSIFLKRSYRRHQAHRRVRLPPKYVGPALFNIFFAVFLSIKNRGE